MLQKLNALFLRRLILILDDPAVALPIRSRRASQQHFIRAPTPSALAMQTPPPAAAAPSPRLGDRYVVRLLGALAELLGQENDREENLYFEDEVLGILRAATLALSTPTAAAEAGGSHSSTVQLNLSHL